jgi:hypothetical protein
MFFGRVGLFVSTSGNGGPDLTYDGGWIDDYLARHGGSLASRRVVED